MAAEDLSPQWNEQAFICPHCGIYAHMRWDDLLTSGPLPGSYTSSVFQRSICAKCHDSALWHTKGVPMFKGGPKETIGTMVWPVQQLASPKPHPEMPEECVQDFEEARCVASQSPRAAAALLRLCVQRLCKALGCKGENINNDIGDLVSRGLPVEIKQALDVVRVVGNNAVHPGKMSLDDTPEVVASLFGLINFIVDRMISQPKQIAALHDLLPAEQKAAIEARDGRSSAK